MMNRNLYQKKQQLPKAQMERGGAIARKFLAALDIDPALYDTLTKRQRTIMLWREFPIPTVKPDKEGTVPRHIIRALREQLFSYMRTHYMGNPDARFTYFEAATLGLGASFNVCMQAGTNAFHGTPQQAISDRMRDAMCDLPKLRSNFAPVVAYMRETVNGYSQINYRFYGFRYEWDGLSDDTPTPSKNVGRFIFYITAQESEQKCFKINGVRRLAYRVKSPADGEYCQMEQALVSRRLVYPFEPDTGKKLALYIQSHALHRCKERLDVFTPQERNNLLMRFLVQQVYVATPSMCRTMLACVFDDAIFGYFVFVVKGDDLVVTSFLPTVSDGTPDGRALYHVFRFSKAEFSYLGLDKLSFYRQVDFEKNELLRIMRDKTQMGKIAAALDRYFTEHEPPANAVYSEERTRSVNTFLYKWAMQQSTEEHDEETEPGRYVDVLFEVDDE